MLSPVTSTLLAPFALPNAHAETNQCQLLLTCSGVQIVLSQPENIFVGESEDGELMNF